MSQPVDIVLNEFHSQIASGVGGLLNWESDNLITPDALVYELKTSLKEISIAFGSSEPVTRTEYMGNKQQSHERFAQLQLRPTAIVTGKQE